MKKSKIITVLIILVIILLVIFFIFGGKKTALSPIKDIIDTTMPILDSKEGILGNKDDLISFSIVPQSKLHGIVSYRGVIKGGYFFEANILINVLDSNKKSILKSNAMAKTDWMTAEGVEFEGFLDFTDLPTGPAYIEIHNDNASGLPENDKSILIPIIIN